MFFGLFPGLNFGFLQQDRRAREKSAECPKCTLSKCCSPLVLFAVIIAITYYILSKNCISCEGLCNGQSIIVKLPGQTQIFCVNYSNDTNNPTFHYVCDSRKFLVSVQENTDIEFSAAPIGKPISCVPTLPPHITNDLSEGWMVYWKGIRQGKVSNIIAGYFYKLTYGTTDGQYNAVAGDPSPCLSDPLYCDVSGIDGE